MARPEIITTIRERADHHPNETFLLFEDAVIDWRRFEGGMWSAANALVEAGVEPGDRVAVILGNCPEFLYSYFGLLAAGAAPVPVNINQRGNALRHILSDSGAVVAVADNSLVDAVAAVEVPGLKILTPKDWDRYPPTAFELPVGARSGLGILYTSGTTGPPKGVVAEGYDLQHIHELLRALEVDAGETIYTALPLYHGNALILSTMGAIWNDWKLALARRFSASQFWSDIARYKAVSFTTLGAMIPILLKQQPISAESSNEARICLSAGCQEWAWRKFEIRYGVRLIEFYGMVDYPGYLMNDGGPVGSMGKPIGVTAFSVAKDGELLLQHPGGRLTHYHNNPEATDAAFRDGWFHTGDLARTDEEGWFYYSGRKTQSIRRRGENISAWEIESVVNQHPDVFEAAASSVPSPLGEDEVKLTVVLRPGSSTTAPDLRAYCKGKMAAYAIPLFVEVRDALPKTGTHRIDYGMLRAEGLTSTTWRAPEGATPARS